MQTRNKQITHDDQLWIRPSFLRIQLTGTSAYTRLTEDLLNIRVIEWCRGRLNKIGNLCYFSKCGLSVSDTFRLCWFFGWASLHTSSLFVRGFEDLSSGIRGITSLLTSYVECVHLSRQRNLGAYATLSSLLRRTLRAHEGFVELWRNLGAHLTFFVPV